MITVAPIAPHLCPGLRQSGTCYVFLFSCWFASMFLFACVATVQVQRGICRPAFHSAQVSIALYDYKTCRRSCLALRR